MGTIDLGETDALRAAVNLLQWTKARKRELSEVEDGARAIVERALGDNEAGTVDGQAVVTWSHGKRTALDQKLLKKNYPEAMAASMKTSATRTFTVL